MCCCWTSCYWLKSEIDMDWLEIGIQFQSTFFIPSKTQTLSRFSVLNTCELQVIWEDETLHFAFHWIMNSFSSSGCHTVYIHLILFVWEQQLWEAGIVLSWCLEHCLMRTNIITLFDLPVSCPASALALTPGTETIFSVLLPFVAHQITLTAAPLLIISFHPSLPP